MRDVFNEIVSFLNFNHILAVFFICVVASLIIIITNKKKLPATALIIYSGITAVLLLFLPTAFVFRKFQTVFFTYTTLWAMVPVIPVTAFALTRALPEIKKLKKPVGIITFLLCVFLLLSCGTLGVLSKEGKELPNYKVAEITFGDSAPILQKMDEVSLNAAENGDDSFVFLAAPAITEYARQYSGNIKMLFGRDIWDGSLAAYNYNSYTEDQLSLYEWMLYSDAYGCQYYGETIFTEDLDYSNLDYASMDLDDTILGGLAYAQLAKSLGVDAIVFTINERTDRAALDYIENALSAHSEYVEVSSPVCEGYLIMYL